MPLDGQSTPPSHTDTPPVDAPPVNIPPADTDNNSSKGGSYYKTQANQLKMKADELERANQEMAKKLSEFEDNNLRQSNQWQELANKYKQEKEDLSKQHSEFKNYFVQEKKLETIKREAIKAGIRDEALQDLDIVDASMVQIETTSTGKVNVLNADEFVQNLKTVRPYWFKNSQPPMINDTNPSMTAPKPMTTSDILKLQKSNPAEYQKQMLKLVSERNKK